MNLALALLAGYLIGSIPFAVVVTRLTGGFDTRRDGTRNPGATNVFKNVGRVAGAAVGLLDFFKALVPALLVERLPGCGVAEATAIAVGAVLGHDYSIFLRFRGGKGGASTLGVLAYLDFPALLVTGAVWAAALPALRGRRFVAGPTALSLFPLLTALHARPPMAWIFPSWADPITALSVPIGIALSILLWTRIVPGLKRAPAERAG
jgi:glycerol-3-phosphate acyltransferase PlsY